LSFLNDGNLNLVEFDDGAVVVVVVVAEAIIDDDNEIFLLASKALADAAVVCLLT